MRTTSVASYFQLDTEVRNISLDCLIFAVDRTSVVGERKLSFVNSSGEPILLSMSPNIQNIVDHGSRKERDSIDEDRSEFQLLSMDGIVQIIVDGGSRKDRDLVEEREVNFTHFLIGDTARNIVDN